MNKVVINSGLMALVLGVGIYTGFDRYDRNTIYQEYPAAKASFIEAYNGVFKYSNLLSHVRSLQKVKASALKLELFSRAHLKSHIKVEKLLHILEQIRIVAVKYDRADFEKMDEDEASKLIDATTGGIDAFVQEVRRLLKELENKVNKELI